MKLNAHETQILLVHLQRKTVDASVTECPRRIEVAAGVLMQAAALYSIPTTFALVSDGLSPPRPIDSVADFANPENSFVAELASPFLDQRIRRRLDLLGRRNVIVGGSAAEVAVLHTAIDALGAGFRVLVPVDLVGSGSRRTERVALNTIEHAGGETTSTATLLSMLSPEFGSKRGGDVLSLIESLG